MGQSTIFKQTSNHCEFLDRDILSHPPLHSPDINTLDKMSLRKVEGMEMDHPASFIEVSQHIHERDVQPFYKH